MNKLFTKIAALALGATMAVGVGVAIASNSKEVAPAHAAGEETSTLTFSSAPTSGNSYNASQSDSAKASYTWTTDSTYISADTDGSYKSIHTGSSSKTCSYQRYVSSSFSNYLIKSVSFRAKSNGTSPSCAVTINGESVGSKSLTNSYQDLTINNTAEKQGGDLVINFSMNSAKKNIMVSWISVVYEAASSKTLSSIALSGTYPTTFTQGDAFSHDGMTVTATYDDETTADVTSSATFSGYNMSTTGNQTVTVSYTEGETTKTTTYSITVNAPKTPASVSSSGQTTTFDAGDTFTYGGTLTATYTDSSSKAVSPTSFKYGNAGINPTTSGTVITPGTTELTRDDHNGKTIYVLYTENNTTVYTSYVITVNAISSVTFTAGVDVGTATAAGQSGTITKSGISFYCSSIRNHDAPYRLYKDSTVTFTSTVGNMAKIEFSGSSSDKISNIADATTGTLVTDSTNNKATWTGDASTVSFTMTAQGRADTIVVTLASTEPLVELDASSATSVSMLKDDSDTSVKVHVVNITTKTWSFTFDEDEQEGITTSSYISVSAGAAVSDVHTLTITTKAVGSTVMHISVSGTACATTIPVTVAAKPASMMVTESDHETQITTLELQSGGSTKQVYWIGEDTDGNAYSIAAAQVNGEIVSGSSVTISSGAGTVITPQSAGTSVIRYSLKVLSSVYAEITVNVVDDYKTTVNSITFNSNLSDTQGDAVDSSAVFATKVANTHFGSTTAIDDNELLFNYDNNRASAETINVFSYDFSHGTTIDSTHKSQTIYVFVTFDSSYSGNFTITIEQKNDPLTAITFTNPNNHAVNVTRGDTFQLEWAYTPANPTDGKEVEFVIDTNASNIDITVSSTGLISIGSYSNLGTALVLIQSAHDDTIQDYVNVTATLESMKYIVNEEESLTPVSTVSSGDRVYMVATATDHSNKTYEFNGYPGTYGGATEYTTTVAKLQLLVVEAGTESGTVAFKLSGGDNDGEYISYSGSSNTLNHTSTKDKSASWTVDGSTITNANTTARQIWLNWNNGTPRFACYTNKTSTTGYYCPTFIKVTGGDTEYDVTTDLFNGVHNNFGGSGKTYEWDATCSSFDEDAWLDACVALTEITSYSSYKINRAVADMSGNEIEVFLAKYDAIVRKFGTTHDHLDRFAEGGINYNERVVTPMTIISNSTNTAAIIVVISVISVSAIGGYFFLRKRREEN